MIKGLDRLSTFIRRKVNGVRAGGRCVACLATYSDYGLCAGCRADLPANRWHCPICALPRAFDASGVCGDCQTHPPSFSSTIAPWRYQFPVDGMIRQYKQNGQRQFARPLIIGLSRALSTHLNEAPPQALIPAPMHWQRRWQRGFNQAADIAEVLGAELGIPVHQGLVRRRRSVHSQRGLNRAHRLANLQGVFEVTGDVPARVAIVDDVVTTGATARALADALTDAGAREVQVWALARTP